MSEAKHSLPEELCDWNLTIEEAEGMIVPYGEFHRETTLKWIALHNPAYLDRLLDRYEPGTIFFHALVLVNEKYVTEVAAAVDGRNSQFRDKARIDPNRAYILPSILHNWPYGEDREVASVPNQPSQD